MWFFRALGKGLADQMETSDGAFKVGLLFGFAGGMLAVSVLVWAMTT